MSTVLSNLAGQPLRELLTQRGWKLGTDLEDRVALHLSRCGWKPGEVQQQYRLLGYRLDFAWPEIAVCLEADGWYHQNLDVIERDRRRDARLRDAGWLTFRVDWTSGPDRLFADVAKVTRLVRMMLSDPQFRAWAKEARDARVTHGSGNESRSETGTGL